MANKFTNEFFSNKILEQHEILIERLTWGDLTKENYEFETKMGITVKTGIMLSQLQYINLKNGYEILQKKVKKRKQ